MKDELEKFMKEIPASRQRKNKDRAIGRVLERHYITGLPIETLMEMIGEVISLDRYWRLIMSEHEDWQEGDYKDKDRLEQEKQISLGYQAGFEKDLLEFDNRKQ